MKSFSQILKDLGNWIRGEPDDNILNFERKGGHLENMDNPIDPDLDRRFNEAVIRELAPDDVTRTERDLDAEAYRKKRKLEEEKQ